MPASQHRLCGRLTHFPIHLVSRSRNSWGTLLAAALLGPVAGHINAWAAEPAPASNAEEIIITATRNQRPLSQVPMSVTVLGRSEILETPAQAVDDLLRTVPGLNLPAGSSLVTHPKQVQR